MKPQNDDDVRSLLHQMRDEGEVKFTAGIYNRPLSRGICFRFDDELGEIGLEDVIPEGNFEIDITIRQPNKK